MSLATLKHSREERESEVGTCTDHQKKVKRPRKAFPLQERLSIIGFWEENQHIPIKEISKKSNVPRTTIHEVIEDKDKHKHLATSRVSRGMRLERYSMAESRFLVLEELLVAWFLDARSRGFFVTDQKIKAQAFEIHRMLSGQVSEPLLPYTLSPGWLQRFKERQNRSMLGIPNHSDAIHQEEDWSFPEVYAGRFSGSLEDVYMCGITIMYSGRLPTSTYDGSHQDPEVRISDAPIPSVLLCCNVKCGSFQPPHVFSKCTVQVSSYRFISSSL
jgi:hypothetical protein